MPVFERMGLSLTLQRESAPDRPKDQGCDCRRRAEMGGRSGDVEVCGVTCICLEVKIENKISGGGDVDRTYLALGISDSGRLQVDWFYFISPRAPFHLLSLLFQIDNNITHHPCVSHHRPPDQIRYQHVRGRFSVHAPVKRN